MDFFAILEISQTTDEEVIKKAYREKLLLVNPEDDQEGFKRLRTAYEQALAWARRPKEEKRQEGPIDVLLGRFEAVYEKMDDRTNPDAWRELLRDPLFSDLDLEENAKWRFFSWLSEHWRLPAQIWRLLDQFFFIAENVAEFREHLPIGFVDFMEQKLSGSTQQSEFPYERFRLSESGEKADYDVFLAGYDELCRLMEDMDQEGREEQGLKAVEQKLQYIESMGLYHPWLSLDKARYLVRAGREQEAVELIRELLDRDGDEIQVEVGCARLLRELGFAGEARQMFERLLKEEKLPDGANYYVHINMAELYEEEDRLAEARKLCLNAYELYRTDEAFEVLSRLNNALIDRWTQTPDKLTPGEALQLAWCFIQSNREKEGLDFLEAHGLLEEDTYKCHRARAVIALQAGHCEDVAYHCEAWRQKLEEYSIDGCPSGENDGDEEPMSEEERRDSVIYSWATEGKAFQIMAGQTEGEAAAELFQKAEEAYGKGLALKPDDINILMSRMMLLREQKEYESMAALCEQIKKIDSGFYWAYFYAQEAYEGLRKAQEVVDNFYEAKRIYAGHADIYERAADVFLNYRQYRDASGILDQAKEAGVSSARLKLQRIIVMRELAGDEAALRQADAYAEEAIAAMEADEAPGDILADAYLERAYIQGENNAAAFRDTDKIIGWAMRSIELKDTVNARYALGRAFFLFAEDAQGAMVHLRICEERGMTFCWMYYYIARCQEDFSDWDNAIVYYKKAMEAGPDEIDFAWRVAWLYRRKFARTGQITYYEQASEYMNRQLELCEADASDYWQLSEMHERIREYARALEEIDHALETDKRARNWGHKAQILELMHRREEAVPVYEKALEAEIERGEDYAFGYGQMADYFCEMRLPEEGIVWFRAWMSRVQTEEQRAKNLDHIKCFYIQLGEYDRALETIVERYGSAELASYGCDSWEQEGERIEDVLDLYQNYMSADELAEKAMEAEALLEAEAGRQLTEDLEGKFGAYREIAYCWSLYILDDTKGLYHFRKALSILQNMGDDAEDSDYDGVLENLMACCSRLGDLEQAKEYRSLFMKRLEQKYGECSELGLSAVQMHEACCCKRRHNLYQLFNCAYFTGDYEKARLYVEEMAESPWCSFCTRVDCTELWECRGYLALLDGEPEKAEEYFIRSDECAARGNSTAVAELRRLHQLSDGNKGGV